VGIVVLHNAFGCILFMTMTTYFIVVADPLRQSAHEW